MQTNIIVGRFQSPYLHDGHKYLIDEVVKNKNKTVIVLGDSHTKFTNKHPFSFEIRKEMINLFYSNIEIVKLMDYKSDEVWSQKLDELVSKYSSPVLFGGRDSFIPYYKGKFPCFIIPANREYSATEIRNRCKETEKFDNNIYYRKGIIHTVENRFPITHPTVDIALVNFNRNEILLGRKPNNKEWCFIGGFVDTNDKSLEYAAQRELTEETGGIWLEGNLTYITSQKINDWRYKGTNDGIMTTLFLAKYSEQNPNNYQASDDLEELQWFSLENFDTDILVDEHQELFNILKEKI